MGTQFNNLIKDRFTLKGKIKGTTTKNEDLFEPMKLPTRNIPCKLTTTRRCVANNFKNLHATIRDDGTMIEGWSLIKKLGLGLCKKYRHISLINKYKVLCFKDINSYFKTDETKKFELLFNDIFCSLISKFDLIRRLQQKITLLDYYILMDFFRCNTLLFNEKEEYVMYELNRSSNKWLIMKYNSPYDIEYIKVTDKISNVVFSR